MSYNMRALIGKLNPTARSVMEGATGLCVSRTHYSVEFHHYLAKLMETDNTDATRIFRHYGVDTSKFTREIQVALDKMKRGNTGGPALSETIMELLKEVMVDRIAGLRRARDSHRLYRTGARAA